jgi:hypothetical protein
MTLKPILSEASPERSGALLQRNASANVFLRLLRLSAALLVSWSAAQAQVTLSLHAPPVSPGEVSTLSLTVDQALSVAGGDLVMSGPDFVLPGPAETTAATSDFLVASRSQPGRIQIAFARSKGLEEPKATILQVPLMVAKTAPLGTHALTVDSARFYSDVPAALASRVANGEMALIAPDADLDGNGLPDAWETRYFGATHDSAASDFDQDGSTNFAEFKAGTDPASADSVLRILKAERTSHTAGAGPAIQWQAQAGRNYSVEWSDGPLGPNMVWHRVYNPVFQSQAAVMSWLDDGTRTYVDPSWIRERYYRILVVTDPP